MYFLGFIQIHQSVAPNARASQGQLHVDPIAIHQPIGRAQWDIRDDFNQIFILPILRRRRGRPQECRPGIEFRQNAGSNKTSRPPPYSSRPNHKIRG
jgi:hypothetical protein